MRVHDWGWTEPRKDGYIVVIAEPGEHIDRIWSRANRAKFSGLAVLAAATATAIICLLLHVPAPRVWFIIGGVAFTAQLIAFLTTGALRNTDPDTWAHIPDTGRTAEQQHVHDLVTQLRAGAGPEVTAQLQTAVSG